jgi:hypothetical protein
MPAPRQRRFFHALQRVASSLGLVSLSVLTTLLVQHLVAPAGAAAHSVPAELHAQAFVLDAPDGTEIARLGPGSSGNANLWLYDSDGHLHLVASGDGDLLAYGSGNTALAQLYADPTTNASGLLLRDANGTMRIVAAQGPDSGAVNVRDASGQLRVGIGTLAGANGESTPDYGLRVRAPDGSIITTVP